MDTNGGQAARYDAGWRLGRGGFLVAWIVLSGVADAAPLAAWFGLGGAGAVALAAALAIFAAGTAARAVVAGARLRALGRPTSQALWGLVPGGDVVLMVLLAGPTPSDAVRAKRVRSWITQVGPFEAWGRAARWLAPSAVVGVPTAALAALVQGGGGEVFRDAVVARAASGEGAGLAQGLTMALLAVGLYTALQYGKRTRASRASWLPTLLLAPVAVLAAAFAFAPALGKSGGAALMMLVEIAWTLSVGSLVGGLAAAVWIVAGRALHEGRSVAPGDVLADAARHAGDVLVAWGARNQIVQLGLQVVVPGVWYAISFAFSDVVVVVHPERSMFGGSTELTRGVRSKIFTMLLVGFLLQLVTMIGVSLAFLPPDRAFGALFDPSIVPLPAVLLGDLLGWLIAWWSTLAMMVVFFERDGLLAAKRERDAAAAGPAAP